METYLPDPPPPEVPLQVQKLPAGLRVGWSSGAGHVYRLEHSGNLADWQPVTGSPDYHGAGDWMEADDLSPGDSGRGFTHLRIFRFAD